LFHYSSLRALPLPTCSGALNHHFLSWILVWPVSKTDHSSNASLNVFITK
jgi:hypothetical protein